MSLTIFSIKKNFRLALFIFMLLAASQHAKAQTYITWSPASNVNTINGTFPGGTVIITNTGSGNAVRIDSPPPFGTNLITTVANQKFSTGGPNDVPPSKKITFTFSTPVILTRYNMADIDKGLGWDDTFTFTGVAFTSTTSTNCTTTVTGATATTAVGSNAEYASWFNATAPVTTFSLDYAVTGGVTHEYLAYSLEVMLASTSIVNSPTVCMGSSATVTATSATPGTYSYAWTVPTGATPPGNVSTFATTTAGIYSVIITNLVTGAVSPSASGTVTINPILTPAFTQIAPICAGTSLVLPTTSTNGVTGTWSPALNNTTTTTYTFSPTAGLCAVTASMTISIIQRTVPTFPAVAAICSGAIDVRRHRHHGNVRLRQSAPAGVARRDPVRDPRHADRSV